MSTAKVSNLNLLSRHNFHDIIILSRVLQLKFPNGMRKTLVCRAITFKLIQYSIPLDVALNAARIALFTESHSSSRANPFSLSSSSIKPADNTNGFIFFKGDIPRFDQHGSVSPDTSTYQTFSRFLPSNLHSPCNSAAPLHIFHDPPSSSSTPSPVKHEPTLVSVPLNQQPSPIHPFSQTNPSSGSPSPSKSQPQLYDKYLFYERLRSVVTDNGLSFDRTPIIAHKPIDWYNLYVHVTKRNGFEAVIANKQWKHVAKAMKIPSTCTDHSTRLRLYYAKYLKPFELKYFRPGVLQTASTTPSLTPTPLSPPPKTAIQSSLPLSSSPYSHAEAPPPAATLIDPSISTVRPAPPEQPLHNGLLIHANHGNSSPAYPSAPADMSLPSCQSHADPLAISFDHKSMPPPPSRPQLSAPCPTAAFPYRPCLPNATMSTFASHLAPRPNSSASLSEGHLQQQSSEVHSFPLPQRQAAPQNPLILSSTQHESLNLTVPNHRPDSSHTQDFTPWQQQTEQSFLPSRHACREQISLQLPQEQILSMTPSHDACSEPTESMLGESSARQLSYSGDTSACARAIGHTELAYSVKPSMKGGDEATQGISYGTMGIVIGSAAMSMKLLGAPAGTVEALSAEPVMPTPVDCAITPATPPPQPVGPPMKLPVMTGMVGMATGRTGANVAGGSEGSGGRVRSGVNMLQVCDRGGSNGWATVIDYRTQNRTDGTLSGNAGDELDMDEMRRRENSMDWGEGVDTSEFANLLVSPCKENASTERDTRRRIVREEFGKRSREDIIGTVQPERDRAVRMRLDDGSGMSVVDGVAGSVCVKSAVEWGGDEQDDGTAAFAV